jgi:hypothetical protein
MVFVSFSQSPLPDFQESFYLISVKMDKTLREKLIFDCFAASIHDTGFARPLGVNPFFYVQAIFHYEMPELRDASVVKPIHRKS